MKKILFICGGFILGLVMFAGCGGGSDSIDSIMDIKNPDVVQNVAVYAAHKRLRVTWTKSSDPDVEFYKIYRSNASSGGFNHVGSVGQTNSPYFQDEGEDKDSDGIPDGLTNNITYFYKVTAFNRADRETPLSLAAAVAGTPGQLANETIDLAVDNVRAYGSKNQAYVTWNRLEHDRLFGYNVYRSTSASSTGFELIAVTPKDKNSFVDGGLAPSENYIYQVSPAVSELDLGNSSIATISSGLLEGRKKESRAVRPLAGDSTIPKPPGSSPGASISVKASASIINNVNGVLLQWTRPTANTDGSVIVDNDDLISGAYMIYRSSNLYGPYDLVGIIENIGSAAISEYFDPKYGDNDHTSDYYYVVVGDDFGSVSERSDIASVNAATPPPTVKSLSATSGNGFGAIQISWKEVTSLRGIDGYNLYRSPMRDIGYTAVAYNVTDENGSDPEWFQFTDVSSALMIGQTYYYKVSATSGGMESSLSAATAASPGPANGIIILEGENAVKIDSYLQGPLLPTPNGRIPPATNAGQFWPEHWASYNRMGYHSPFSANGVLFVNPANFAGTDIPAGERLDLKWEVDIQALLGGATGGAVTADVYLITADDTTTGQYKLFVDDKPILTTATPGTELPSAGSTGFDGIQTEINFRDQSYSTPLQPTKRLIGTLRVDHLIDYDVPNIQYADTEIIYMSIVHSGPASSVGGQKGSLKLDALVLVVR
jgi:fibronectin type 3 domain-containing protein